MQVFLHSSISFFNLILHSHCFLHLGPSLLQLNFQPFLLSSIWSFNFQFEWLSPFFHFFLLFLKKTMSTSIQLEKLINDFEIDTLIYERIENKFLNFESFWKTLKIPKIYMQIHQEHIFFFNFVFSIFWFFIIIFLKIGL